MDDSHGRALLVDAYSSHGDAVAASLGTWAASSSVLLRGLREVRCTERLRRGAARLGSRTGRPAPAPPAHRNRASRRKEGSRDCMQNLPSTCAVPLTPVGSPRRERPPPCGCIDAQRGAPGRGDSRGSRLTVGPTAPRPARTCRGVFLFTTTAALGSAGTVVALVFASVAFVRGFWRSPVGQRSEGIGEKHYGCVSFGAYAWGRA